MLLIKWLDFERLKRKKKRGEKWKTKIYYKKINYNTKLMIDNNWKKFVIINDNRYNHITTDIQQ